MSGSTRLAIQALAQNALVNAAVLPLASVLLAQDWPKDISQYPLAVVRIPREVKDDRTKGVGRPQFWTTAWVEIEVGVSDADTETANTDLQTLLDAVEGAILNDDLFEQFAHHFSTVETNCHQDASGETHLGMGVVRIAVVFEEDFAPLITDLLAQINLKADMVNQFDATGTYPPPPNPDPNPNDPDFPAAYTNVAPAPRTSGPDGRAEGGFTIDLPPPA